MRIIITGDCLNVLPDTPARSVHLAYLDPPYMSQRDYSGKVGSISESVRFNDIWGSRSEYMRYMIARIKAIYRVLKPNGNFVLHCDPSCSHYLKVALDAIFGERNFRNEIVWCYTGPSGTNCNFPKKHDTLLWYSKSGNYTFNYLDVCIPYKPGTTIGAMFDHRENMSPEQLKTYIDRGKLPESHWHIEKLRGDSEVVGYPTQKPLKLLHRIIRALSNEGDLILDPFCGSGTTLLAAELNHRQWIGIDLNAEVVEIMRHRLLGDCRLFAPEFETRTAE